MPHIHDKIDYTAEVFIVYRNKVLLRKHDKYNKWLSVGGHIELHEDPNEAVVREVKEEVGLDVVLDDFLKPKLGKESNNRELIPPYFLNRNIISETHEHVTFVYFATANSDHISPRKEEKSVDCKWFTKEEVEWNDEIQPSIKYYALQALAKLS